jgi:hypothetical protein
LAIGITLYLDEMVKRSGWDFSFLPKPNIAAKTGDRFAGRRCIDWNSQRQQDDYVE